jgi:plasmid stabilization system protein ParE
VALEDLMRIGRHLRREAPLRADGILDRIVSRGESLTFAPERGRTPPELEGVVSDRWREIQEPPWRIVYRVAASGAVEIHGVLDGRRDLQELLMERLLDG